MPFPIMPILKSVAGGAANQAGVFDGVSNGKCNTDVFPEDVILYELDVTFKLSSLSANNTIFAYKYSSPSYLGYEFMIFNDGKVRANIEKAPSGFTIIYLLPTGTIVAGELYNINVKIIYTDPKYYIRVSVNNDEVVDQTEVLAEPIINSGQTRNTHIGTRNGSFNNFNGDIHALKFYKLNVLGARVSELINLDWNNGDINTVPNIGVDKPASSDMTWVPAGSGTYVDI